MTVHQKLRQLREAARAFTKQTITSVSGPRPSSATVERVARQLVNTLKPVIQNDHDEAGQPSK